MDVDLENFLWLLQDRELYFCELHAVTTNNVFAQMCGKTVYFFSPYHSNTILNFIRIGRVLM